MLNVGVLNNIHTDGYPILKSHFNVFFVGHIDRDGILREHLPSYHGVIVRTETMVDREFIDAARNLRVIGRAGVGLDNIDSGYALSRGIHVVNTPKANTVSAAEHTIGMMLAIARHIPQATGGTRQGRWERQRFMGTELNGKVLGIIGCGQVGSHVAKIAQAFGMRILGYDPYILKETVSDIFDDMVENLTSIFPVSDFVTLHTPLNDETRCMVNRNLLSFMKRGAYLINCARGAIVDQDDLIWALDEGYLAGYACDVFKEEPVEDPNHPFYKRRNVICTPHIGAQTYEAQRRVSLEICEKVRDALL
jgi:D-3-phosphoglycerate dehydrogenase / 2-oxoglutarate reductase